MVGWARGHQGLMGRGHVVREGLHGGRQVGDPVVGRLVQRGDHPLEVGDALGVRVEAIDEVEVLDFVEAGGEGVEFLDNGVCHLF